MSEMSMIEAKKGKLTDYICKRANASGFSDELIQKLHLKFPESYCNAQIMAHIAKEISMAEQSSICVLPFCHTVEAEAMGGNILLTDGKFGPRTKEYAYQSIEELLELPDIDFSKGRIRAVLDAGRILHENGQKAALEISGLFTILNALIDTAKVFKAWRKNAVLVEQIMAKLSENLYAFFAEAKKAGFSIISYADPAGSVSIVGPKFAEMAARQFTYPLLKRVQELADEDCIIHLCPKTTLTLLELDLAKREYVQFVPGSNFVQACLKAVGQEKIIGQACIKNANCVLRHGKLWALQLV